MQQFPLRIESNSLTPPSNGLTDACRVQFDLPFFALGCNSKQHSHAFMLSLLTALSKVLENCQVVFPCVDRAYMARSSNSMAYMACVYIACAYMVCFCMSGHGLLVKFRAGVHMIGRMH